MDVQEIHDYMRAREEHDAITRQKTEAYAKLKAAENRLIERFDDLGWKTGPLMADGTKVTLVTNMDISVNQQNQEEVCEWVAGRYGDPDKYRTFKMDKWAIRKQIKEELENGELSEHEIPLFLRYTNRPSIRVEGIEKARENR